MKRLFILIAFILFSFLDAGNKLNINRLNNIGGLWYKINTDTPFTGVAYSISEKTGNKTLERRYINGIYSGKYSEWWENGENKIKGTYRKGLMNGRWKFYYKNGNVLCTGSYENTNNGFSINGINGIPKKGRSGLWTFWDMNGKKMEEGYFKKGEQFGKWAFWDKKGKRYSGTKIDYEAFIDVTKDKDRLGKYLIYGPKEYGEKKYIHSFGLFHDNRRHGEWTFFDRSRAISAIINYKNGEPIGHYITYHNTGYKQSEGFVNGLDEIGDLIKVGSWVYKNLKGRKIKEINYVNGVQEGKTIFYSPNGQELSEVYYKNNKIWSGELTLWYAEGAKKESGQYYNGKREGPWAFYYKNGQNYYLVNYHQGKKDGIYTQWDSYGRLVKESEYENGNKITDYIIEYDEVGYIEINKRNNLLYGPWVRWYSAEKKAEEGYYINDKKWGIWTLWYENGLKKFEGEYINNQKNSYHKKWNENSMLVENIEYKDGKILSEYYFKKVPDGFLEFREKNGVLDGGWTKWYNIDFKLETGVYKSGKKIGKWTSWYENRQKRHEAKYVDGVLSGNFLEWDKNGKIIKDINYIDGQRVNEYIIYNEENYVLVVNKVRGVLEGIWEKWSLENIKIEEGTYKNGVKIGTWYRYDSGGQLSEEFTYDESGRFLFDIKYYNNGNVKRYRDHFSKTIRDYNYDGSLKGELKTF